MLAVSGWLLYPTITMFVTVCLILILLVLIQKGRGGGLAGAFGGAGGNTAFGAKTGDVLTWATSVVFGVFVLLAIALNLMTYSTAAAKASALPTAAPSSDTSRGTSTVPTPVSTPIPAPVPVTPPMAPTTTGSR